MKEIIRNKNEKLTIAIMGSEINSYRMQAEEETSVRVYRDGYIGVAGAVGKCDIDELTKKATEKLENKIEYPCIPVENKIKSIDNTVDIFAEKDFIPNINKLLDRLKTECPDFIFSNNVYLTKSYKSYENDCGTHLKHKGNSIRVSLLIKDKHSANVFDTGYYYEGNSYDIDKIVSDIKYMYDSYYNEVEVDTLNLPVIIEGSALLEKVVFYYNGEMYAQNASLLSGKLNEKLFGENIDMYYDYLTDATTVPFFDDEGVYQEDGKFYVVKNGVFCGLLNNKKIAQKFNQKLSGNAISTYDTVPQEGERIVLELRNSNKPLNKIVPGKAIYVAMSSGGDFTPTGNYSMPIQLAFLVENGKLIGRLKGSYSMSGNYFEMLNENYIGAVKAPFMKEDKNTQFMIIKSNITKA